MEAVAARTQLAACVERKQGGHRKQNDEKNVQGLSDLTVRGALWTVVTAGWGGCVWGKNDEVWLEINGRIA